MTTWAIGDVHGCAEELRALLARLPRGDDAVLVGDLFDKGPDPSGVLALVKERGLRAVLGNHDVLVRDHGRARLGLAPPPGRTPAPYVTACLERLEEDGTLEEAVRLCEALPLFRDEAGFVVVHAGLDPVRGRAGTDEATATNLRRYPRSGDAKWWTQWPGPEPVVFGHDARQGLVRHEVGGQVRCVGLDTGCVYGGRLTAYGLGEDRFLVEPARKAWHAKG